MLQSALRAGQASPAPYLRRRQKNQQNAFFIKFLLSKNQSV
jgi:hypothetical protein